MGLSGRIAEYFLRNSLTPLIALIALLLGVLATLITPREEEPQINVTMANVFVPFPGASAKDVESLVARPAEQVLSRIAGIEHVYSVSRPGMERPQESAEAKKESVSYCSNHGICRISS